MTATMRRLSLALATLTVLALGSAGAARADTIVVNTTEDAATVDSNPSAVTSSKANACLEGFGATAASIDTAEDRLNDPDGPTGINDPPGNQAPIGSFSIKPCSLRMALEAAATNQPAVSEPGKADTIVFDLPRGAKIRIGDALPPIVVPTKIEGCASFTDKSTPCINLELPAPREAPSLPSAVPENVPGLLVAADEVAISGIAFQGGNPAIQVPPALDAAIDKLSVKSSYFGLYVDGTKGIAPEVAIQLSGSRATIGGPTPGDRNVFAGGAVADDVGVLIAGGARNTIQGNWFGTDASGNAAGDRLGTGIKLAGLGYDLTALVEDVPSQLGAPGAADDVPSSSLFFSQATSNKVGGALTQAQAATPACDGPCNLFAGGDGYAIDIGGDLLIDSRSTTAPVNPAGDSVGVRQTVVEGNQIGVDANRSPAANVKGGILVRNGSPATRIGGNDPRQGNVISNSGGAAIAVQSSAGIDTTADRNSGRSNAKPFIDLGDDGVGNAARGPSGGAQAPTVTGASTTLVTGTTEPGATVLVYLVPEPEHGSGTGDIERFLGSDLADAAGVWEAKVSLPLGRRVTATANPGDGTSELARNFLLPAPPPPPPPPPEQPPARSEPPPPDASPPRIVAVLGKERASDADTRPISVRGVSRVEVQVEDDSGVAKVEVALGLPEVKRKRRKRSGDKLRSAARRCTFIDLKRARLVRRPCTRPPFVPAAEGRKWRLPLSRKVRRLLKPGRSYLLYVRATDRVGNSATKRFVIRILERRQRARARSKRRASGRSR